MSSVSVPEDGIRRILHVLNCVEAFLNGSPSEQDVDTFADSMYPEIAELYYRVFPQWLTQEQDEAVIEYLEANGRGW